MERVEFVGYVMTEKQRSKLAKILEENILERYNGEEYWEQDLIDEFATENKLKRRERGEVECLM